MNNHGNKSCDLGYGAYLFCGLATLLISIASYIPMDNGTSGVLGLLFFVPLVIATAGAMAVGLIQTLKNYKHWPLVVISVLSVLLVMEIMTEFGPVWFYNSVPLIYGTVTCLLSIAWFTVIRKE